MRQKQVIDFLRQLEKPATAAHIKAAIQIDIDGQLDLQQALEANPKVGIDDDEQYFYRPDANIKNKAQLLDFVRKAAAPVAIPEVQDAYKTVLNDVKALKDEGLIISLYSYDPELQCEILYPVDMKLVGVKVDEDVNALWHQIDIAEEDELLKAALLENGLNPAPRKAPRKAANANKERKKQRRKQQRLRTVTNVHMMHLFDGDGPQAIDE